MSENVQPSNFNEIFTLKVIHIIERKNFFVQNVLDINLMRQKMQLVTLLFNVLNQL